MNCDNCCDAFVGTYEGYYFTKGPDEIRLCRCCKVDYLALGGLGWKLVENTELTPKQIARILRIRAERAEKRVDADKRSQCVKELTELLGEDYSIKNNKKNILVSCDFNCNVYVVTKTGFNRRGERVQQGEYRPCGKCHCHYGCHTSKEFLDVCKKYGFSMDWLDCVTAIIC